MKITPELQAKLQSASTVAGGAGEFARRCGIDPGNISRYLSGKVKSISDDNWQKLSEYLDKYNSPPAALGTIRNTPELRNYIHKALSAKQVDSAASLRRLIGYDSVVTMQRLLSGEINWFPDVLGAVFDSLELDRNLAPITDKERDLLPPLGIYRDGAMLVRPIPVVEWVNAASHLEMIMSEDPVMQRWDVDNTPTVPIPVGGRRDTRAFRVNGISMEPKIINDDILLVEPATALEDIPDNKIVVAKFRDSENFPECVVCKRFHRQPDGKLLLTSDNPEGKIIPVDNPADIIWIGVVVRKISEL